MPKRTTPAANIAAMNAESFKTLIDVQRLSLENSVAIKHILSDQFVEQVIVGEIEIHQLAELNKSMKSIAASIKEGSPSISSATVKTKEDRMEAAQSEQRMMSVLEKIEANTRGMSALSAKEKKDGPNIEIGSLLTGLAVAIGAALGMVRAQIKAIKTFIDVLVPEKFILSIQKSIASFAAGISMQLDLVKAAMTEKFSGVVRFFDSVVDVIKSAFSVKEGSGIAKVISTITSTISKFFAPFVEAFGIIRDFLSGPISKAVGVVRDVFATIGAKFSMFTGLISKTAAVVGKLMVPITVIMTLWDTVKGAIEGFEKEGIVGGIAGAIKGFFNSLIFGPVDMIKDATAWVLGVFGFDKAKQALESFNLEKMFSDFVDAIFHPIDTFKKILGSIVGIFDGLKDFTIPEIGFTIPVINKKVAVGPFKPFASGAPTSDTTGSSSTAQISSNPAPTIAAPAPQASIISAQTVADTSNKVNAMKEQTGSVNSTTVIAPSVNNNMKQTQIAKIEAPVRSSDSSLDRYLSARTVY